MRRLLIIVLFITSVLLYGCKEQTPPIEEETVNVLNAELLNDASYVQWVGRTEYLDEEQKRYFYHTATGFSVTFLGTSLSINLHSTNIENTNLRPYFSILLDDQTIQEGKRIFASQSAQEVTLVNNLPYGVHTVTFLKQSEPIDSTTAISKITTDGEFLPPQKRFDMNILVLGGSGVSGNGVFGGPGIPRTTENSSSLHAFPYKTAETMNAHAHFVSSSGWGLKWGYNPTNNDGEINIRNAFDTIGIDDQEDLVPRPFNHHSLVPDYIIINLGGNDYNAHISALSGEERIDAERSFQAAVIELVTYLHDLYPDAFIFWTHTSSANGMLATTVLSDLDPLRSFVEGVIIERSGANNAPIGSRNHASEITHQRNAEILIQKILELQEKNSN